MNLPTNNWTRRTALTAFGAAGLMPLGSTAGATRSSPAGASLEQAVEALRLAMLTGDGKALDELLHDDLIYMHSSGHAQTKTNVKSDLAGKTFFASLVYSDLAIKKEDNVGTVTATVDQTKNLPGGRARASRLTILQIWLNSGPTWKLLARSSYLITPTVSLACPKALGAG